MASIGLVETTGDLLKSYEFHEKNDSVASMIENGR